MSELSERGEERILSAIKDLGARVGGLDARVGKIDCRLHDLEQGQEKMRLNIIELTNMAHNVNRDQFVLNDIMRQIRSDFLKFDERLHHFIVNNNQQNSST